MYQLLQGLKYMHSANIIHSNIKPGNILINANCDLKICDFGLSFVRGNKEIISSGYVATRWYNAPEVLLLYETIGPEIDIWSVGCVMVELILGQPLFTGKSTLNQLSVIVKKIGSPTENDLAGITNIKARRYIESLPHKDPIDWSSTLSGAAKEEIDLISKMLLWDPTKRITANEAVEHPFFAKIHDPSDEPAACPVDEFDFDRHDITMDQMRREIWKEVLHYNPK